MALSEWSDWREWPAKRRARLDQAVADLEELLHECIVMRDEEDRARIMGALEMLTAPVPVHSLSSRDTRRSAGPSGG